MNKYGFNFLWMFSKQGQEKPLPPAEKELDLVKEMGFNFVRIPTDYRYWIEDDDYFNPREEMLSYLDSYLEACQERGLHLNLNIHRAPGYCINRNDIETHNLWKDEIAQKAFVFQWEMFSKRFQGVPSEQLSFDLLNEPPSIGQYGMTREIHEKIIRKTVKAIRAIDPQRTISIDGLGGGNIPLPELADLDVIQCARGYQPMALTHYQAEWWQGDRELPEPEYPGMKWQGKVWNKKTIHEFYKPWRDLEDQGVKIFIGEFGCYNKTDNKTALKWFADLLDLFEDYGWGYALWNFRGNFGIFNHGRPGTRYQKLDKLNGDYRLDKKLLQLLQEHRIQ
ncbi:MAG: glycoside hydrolase family 5 protein [Halanaerobiales bacterium]